MPTDTCSDNQTRGQLCTKRSTASTPMTWVAIKNTQPNWSAALAKATQLARSCGAHVELFVGSDTPGARTSIVLERLAEQVAAHGVSVSTVTRMQRPVHEAILKRAESICADLIVTDCYAGSHIAPALFQLTDWELARLSPIPVLIVKQQRMYRHPKVLAAVDPTPCAW